MLRRKPCRLHRASWSGLHAHPRGRCSHYFFHIVPSGAGLVFPFLQTSTLNPQADSTRIARPGRYGGAAGPGPHPPCDPGCVASPAACVVRVGQACRCILVIAAAIFFPHPLREASFRGLVSFRFCLYRRARRLDTPGTSAACTSKPYTNDVYRNPTQEAAIRRRSFRSWTSDSSSFVCIMLCCCFESTVLCSRSVKCVMNYVWRKLVHFHSYPHPPCSLKSGLHACAPTSSQRLHACTHILEVYSPAPGRTVQLVDRNVQVHDNNPKANVLYSNTTAMSGPFVSSHLFHIVAYRGVHRRAPPENTSSSLTNRDIL